MKIYTVASKTPGATLEAPTQGGVNMELLAQQIRSAFAGRDIWSINVSDYGATITVAIAETGNPDPSDTAIIVAVVAAHNPNELTPEQQEAADLAAELADIQARINELKADVDAINNTGGLKDRLLTNAAWNALTAGQKADLVRDILKGVGGATPFSGVLDIQVSQLSIDVHEAKANIFSLRETKKRIGVE